MMLPTKTTTLLVCLSVACAITSTAAFIAPTLSSKTTTFPRSQIPMARTIPEDSKEYWLDEFKTATGEILNPYTVLQIRRKAELSEIKHAYREMSKRYHPDKQRFRDVLPGRCNDLEEVRDEWERIKLSYEILRDPRTRKRFDRHEVLADPGAAVGRAAAGAALSGLAGVGSGLFAVGAFAFGKLTGGEDQEQPESA